MKKLISTALLIVASPAWADAGDRHSSHGTSKVPGDHLETRYERVPGSFWSWVRAQKMHDTSYRTRSEHRAGYRGYGHDSYRGGDWVRLDRFRTSERRTRQKVIPVNRKVSAIGLTGLKRRALVRDAWVEFDNGKVIPLREMTGRLRKGKSLTHEFRKPRHVKNLIVTVSPGAYRRAYLAVDLLPAHSKEKFRDKGRRHDRKYDDRKDKSHNDRKRRRS